MSSNPPNTKLTDFEWFVRGLISSSTIDQKWAEAFVSGALLEILPGTPAHLASRYGIAVLALMTEDFAESDSQTSACESDDWMRPPLVERHWLDVEGCACGGQCHYPGAQIRFQGQEAPPKNTQPRNSKEAFTSDPQSAAFSPGGADTQGGVYSGIWATRKGGTISIQNLAFQAHNENASPNTEKCVCHGSNFLAWGAQWWFSIKEFGRLPSGPGTLYIRSDIVVLTKIKDAKRKTVETDLTVIPPEYFLIDMTNGQPPAADIHARAATYVKEKRCDMASFVWDYLTVVSLNTGKSAPPFFQGPGRGNTNDSSGESNLRDSGRKAANNAKGAGYRKQDGKDKNGEQKWKDFAAAGSLNDHEIPGFWGALMYKMYPRHCNSKEVQDPPPTGVPDDPFPPFEPGTPTPPDTGNPSGGELPPSKNPPANADPPGEPAEPGGKKSGGTATEYSPGEHRVGPTQP